MISQGDGDSSTQHGELVGLLGFLTEALVMGDLQKQKTATLPKRTRAWVAAHESLSHRAHCMVCRRLRLENESSMKLDLSEDDSKQSLLHTQVW